MGISGVEGLQAASASDYAIAQVTQNGNTQFRQQLSDTIHYSAMRIFHATRECFALEIHRRAAQTRLAVLCSRARRFTNLMAVDYYHENLTKCREQPSSDSQAICIE